MLKRNSWFSRSFASVLSSSRQYFERRISLYLSLERHHQAPHHRMVAMMNRSDDSQLTVREKLDEIAFLLVQALLRAAARKSSEFSADGADKAVDFEHVWSGAVAERVAEKTL
jgi:hypothetical protein